MNDEILLRTWEIYFPTEEYTIYNKEINLIMEIKTKLSEKSLDFFREVKKSRIFECDFEFFAQFQCPASFFRCFSCACSEVIYKMLGEMIYLDTKIVNHNSISQFNEINTSMVGMLVSLIGTCSRVGFKKIENLEGYFQCKGCNKIIKNSIKGNIYKNPKCSCKGKNLIFIQNHPENKCVDKQEIKIQEAHNDNEPASINVIEVDLYGPLVGTAAPGDLTKITGIVRAELQGDAYKLKIECNNLIVFKNKNSYSFAPSLNTDYQVFKEISETPKLMKILIKALFPNIYGHNLIKVGLVLALFGGTKKFVGSNLVRPEIHALIIGDPGLGKSKLLLNVCGVLPKSTYVSGNFCTSSGLTVSITHDPTTGEYMADAGALVVSDGGVCCIDEFDKIDDHTALFEAMEDQKVTVAKGGVCCSVSARSTVIAASNPRYGHFNTKKGVGENIKFDYGLLSRFDLVYILIDNLTEEENYKISNQILKRRITNVDEINSLVDNYRDEDVEVPYSKEMFKKYIEYARSSVNPVLSRSAKQKIKEYYLELRKDKGTSIRNLESLIRLTESFAKMELKGVASLNHAQQAINIYKKVFIKEKEEDKKQDAESVLRTFTKEMGRKVISKDELVDVLRTVKKSKSEEEMIEALNFKGVLIKNKDGRYNIVL